MNWKAGASGAITGAGSMASTGNPYAIGAGGLIGLLGGLFGNDEKDPNEELFKKYLDPNSEYYQSFRSNMRNDLSTGALQTSAKIKENSIANGMGGRTSNAIYNRAMNQGLDDAYTKAARATNDHYGQMSAMAMQGQANSNTNTRNENNQFNSNMLGAGFAMMPQLGEGLIGLFGGKENVEDNTVNGGNNISGLLENYYNQNKWNSWGINPSKFNAKNYLPFIF